VVFLLLALVVGTFFFWLGIPVLVLWGLAEAGAGDVWHFVLGLVTVPFAMIAFSLVLLWLNTLYMRVTGTLPAEGHLGRRRRRVEGPLEPLLVMCLVISVVAGFIWFFFFAENPPRQFI
jgi:hypothetical protein